MLKAKCKTCGKEFSYFPYKKDEAKFCCLACYHKSRKGKLPWNTGLKYKRELPEESRKKMRENAKRNGFGQNQKGKKLSETTKKKISEKFKGELHPKYKGKFFDSGGYVMVYSPNHPNRDGNNDVREHRLVAEKCLGRYLTSKEVIHHINEIRDDNRPENLYLFACNKDHYDHHKAGNQKLISNLI